MVLRYGVKRLTVNERNPGRCSPLASLCPVRVGYRGAMLQVPGDEAG